MNEQQFVYWLQGFVELSGDAPNTFQWQSIKDHLKLVFDKVTPTMRLPLPKIDLKDSPEVKKLLDDARGVFIEPLKYVDDYLNRPQYKPGDFIC